MKKLKNIGMSILIWIVILFIILYFKWASQETTSLPGVLSEKSEPFFDYELIIVTFLGFVSAFYLSLIYLTPKLLFNSNLTRILLYVIGLACCFVIVAYIIGLVLPLYYFFGIPSAIKLLVPVVLLSGLSGSFIALKERNKI